jgi:hypothetical protein
MAMDGKIAFNYISMKDASRVSWDMNAAVHLKNNREKYYYIPEIFSSSYMNVSGDAAVQKNFYFGRFHLAATVGGAYNKNLSNTIFLSNLTEITQNQRKEIYTSDFGYYTSDLMALNGKVQLGYTPQSAKIGQINLSLGTDYVKPAGVITHTSINSLKLGFVF